MESAELTRTARFVSDDPSKPPKDIDDFDMMYWQALLNGQKIDGYRLEQMARVNARQEWLLSGRHLLEDRS
jgi:hypothetical protein